MESLNFVMITKGKERFFIFDDGSSPELLDQELARMANDPELRFTEFDAQLVKSRLHPSTGKDA